MTIVPRTGPFSASCALAITSWYQRGKSSSWETSTLDIRARTLDRARRSGPAPRGAGRQARSALHGRRSYRHGEDQGQPPVHRPVAPAGVVVGVVDVGPARLGAAPVLALDVEVAHAAVVRGRARLVPGRSDPGGLRAPDLEVGGHVPEVRSRA